MLFQNPDENRRQMFDSMACSIADAMRSNSEMVDRVKSREILPTQISGPQIYPGTLSESWIPLCDLPLKYSVQDHVPSPTSTPTHFSEGFDALAIRGCLWYVQEALKLM